MQPDLTLNRNQAPRIVISALLFLYMLSMPLYDKVAAVSILIMLLLYILGNVFEGKSATIFVSVVLPLWLARPSLDRTGAAADA